MQYSSSKNNRRWFVLIGLAILAILLILALRSVFGGGSRSVSVVKLRCLATQNVTPFGDELLYYDGMTLYCLRANGSEHWSYPLGQNASFRCNDSMVAAWSGTQLHLISKNGSAAYNESLTNTIQFAKVGPKYVGVVLGADMSPTLVVKDLQGTTVDTEFAAYEDMILLDLGFFSDGEYLWTTSLDVYGSVPDTMLNTFRVNQSNSGSISLGEHLVYAVVYTGQQLNVISTRQLRQYDYRCVQNSSGTVLVYGWQLIDQTVSGNNAMLLFIPSKSVEKGTMNQLRLIWGKTDKRYSLPTDCIGAAVYNKKIYAFAGNMIYRAAINAQRFDPISLSGFLNGEQITEYLGMLSNGVALVACESDVYAVVLP